MAVSKGTKLEFRRGCRDDFLENGQVVTAKCDPFIIGGIVCITLKEHGGVYCLDHFCELGQKTPAIPANREALERSASPEQVQEAIDQLENLGEKILEETEARASRVAALLAQGVEKLNRRKPRRRQDVYPRNKSRRR